VWVSGRSRWKSATPGPEPCSRSPDEGVFEDFRATRAMVSEAIGEIEVERLKSPAAWLLRAKSPLLWRSPPNRSSWLRKFRLEPLCGFIKQENRSCRCASRWQRRERNSQHSSSGRARSRAQAGRASAGNAGTPPALRHREKTVAPQRPGRRACASARAKPKNHTFGTIQVVD